MNLAGLLSRAALDRPEAVAIYRGEAPWASFATLAGRVSALAGALRGRIGLAPGDRVAIVMRNAPEYLESLYATWWAGLVAVPVNAKLHPDEVRFILEHCGARLAFVAEDWLPGLAEATRGLRDAPLVLPAGGRDYGRLCAGERTPVTAVAPGGLAWLFYTSGTTGRPKGAMLSHANLTRMTEAYFASVDAVPGEGRLLHAAPMSHGSGLYTFTHLARGAAQVVPESGAFDPVEILSLLESHAEVSFFAAPTMVKRLVDAAREGDRRAPGLRTLVYGGAPMYLTDIRAAMDVLGERLAQIYGQGESPMTITALAKAHHADRSHPRWLERLGSVGIAQHGVEVRIRDGKGSDLPEGEAGEVCVRAATVMSGYWRDPQASADALRDGWLWTGDVGALDADGFLTLKDRSKDLIISGGSNIYPREVEEVLLAHPAVAEAAVVGRPDPEWGEVPVAFVVARGEAPSAADLDRLCLDRIARFKRPKEYRFVSSLPKNNYGKVLKTQLRLIGSRGGMMFEGFRDERVRVGDMELAAWIGGTGPALLLLHGYPQTRAIWHKVAARLARRYTVVCPDLRGYGDSGKPATTPDHAPYSKREMARDMVELMRSLGHESFFLAGHDRGGRVAHRLAVDHPQSVARLAVLDIAPTLAMYEQTTEAFARAYWHWFFLILPAPVPEKALGADPLFFLRAKMSPGAAHFEPAAMAEYERCFTPEMIHASCEDYRAAASIDLEHDRADREHARRVGCPLLALWGAHGVVERCFRPLDEWRRVADDVRGQALPAGHYLPEEVPGPVADAFEAFFTP